MPEDAANVAAPPVAATETPFTVALVMKTLTNPFFVEMERGARQAEQELGIELIVKTGAQETSIEQQIAIVRDLLAQAGVNTETEAITSIISPSMLASFVRPVASAVSGAGASIFVMAFTLIYALAGAGSMKPRAESAFGAVERAVDHVVAGQHPEGGGLPGALGPFENQHVVDLDARPHDPRHRGDHPSRAEGPVERRIIGAKIGGGPGCEPRHLSLIHISEPTRPY